MNLQATFKVCKDCQFLTTYIIYMKGTCCKQNGNLNARRFLHKFIVHAKLSNWGNNFLESGDAILRGF